MKRRPVSFGRIARRMGALDSERLDLHGESLEDVLLASGLLDPALAPAVQAAWFRAHRTCSRCGRRRDRSQELRCACPGQAETAA